MTISLNGKWEFTGAGHTLETKIPGDFYSTLLEKGLIPDPYYGFNEQKVLWLNREDFTIERTFSYKKTSGTKAILELNDADTVFDLFINERKAGSGNNMFLRHRFDITKLLSDGENRIKILFHSAEKEAEKTSSKLPYPVPYNKADVYSPHRNLIRKCQCHSGWDWGPALMVQGIYGDIFIETVSTGLFDSLKLNFQKRTVKTDRLWKVQAELNFDSFIQGSKLFDFSVSGPGISEIETKEVFDLQKGLNKLEVSIPVINPFEWKTSDELKEDGLSENPVYLFKVRYSDEQKNIKTFTREFCFSNLKCISEKEKNGGRSLYFENNGRRIFAKGANWIPVDALPSRWTPETYRELLTSAVDANMNCIRVWGGGIYEKDIFYQLCDRLGIIVWQDFMFACALYPVTESFLSSVKEEVTYQVNRLQHHACIGLWCGNNENFGTLNWFPESRNNRDRYLVDYDRLYHGTIEPLVKELDPARLWWPSSPCAGPDDFADNWHSDNKGDMHYWSVWHEKKNFSAYLDIKPRFVSEFGYESMVSLECVKTYSEKKDLNFTSPISEYHQRSPNGNTLMLESFARYFRFPDGFENQIYLSQVQQALAMRTAVDYWRSLEPYCMGSIVWQLNDVWPGPSWSSIEYGGKWKLLHYYEKQFFEPVHLAQTVKDNTVSLFVINDYRAPLKGNIKIRFLDFYGKEISKAVDLEFNTKSNSSEKAFCFSTESFDHPVSDYFIFAELEAKTSKITFRSSTTVFPDLYKHCDIQKGKIKSKISEVPSPNKGTKVFSVSLSAEVPCFFTALDSHKIKGHFSENMFTLLPGTEKTILFKTEESVTSEKFKKEMTVKHLADTF